MLDLALADVGIAEEKRGNLARWPSHYYPMRCQARGSPVVWIKADNERILGRQQVHHRLRVDKKRKPGLYVFLSCDHWWRTFPLIREYEKDPEDIETKSEDHQYDETRDACTFRPIRPRKQVALTST